MKEIRKRWELINGDFVKACKKFRNFCESVGCKDCYLNDYCGNNELTCFVYWLIEDVKVESHSIIKRGDMVKTICDVPNEDGKTQMNQGYNDIPKDTVLKVEEFTDNIYGHFIDVYYDRHQYSLNPKYLIKI